MTQVKEKKGFSWMGLLFGGAYYAGYGKLGKGIVMSLLAAIPLTAIFVQIYAGLKARKELPVGELKFDWGKAIAAYSVTIAVVVGLVAASGNFKVNTQAAMLDDVNGYWASQSNEEMMIDFRQKPYAVGINGDSKPVELLNVDSDNDRLSFKFHTGVVATLIQNWDSEGKTFTLTLVLPNKRPIPLSFVRQL